MRILLTTATLLTLTGCLSPEQVAERQALSDKADTVRLISPEQAQKCKYINQVSAIAELSFFGGMPETEKTAMKLLKIEALKEGANGVRVADRLFDKGRGGADQTRLTLYGDIYKCSEF